MFTRTVFDLPLAWLAYIRLSFAAIIFFVSIELAVFSQGWVQTTSYLPASRLKQAPNQIIGIKTLFPFTSVSWNILGLSFLLSGYISLQASMGNDDIPKWLLQLALACWELAAPFSFLVATVVRYAIWPAVLKSASGDTSNLRRARTLAMHNANVLMALFESALLGGLPVKLSDAALGTLVGACYVIFSWSVCNIWNKPEAGPQYIYFFLDPTLPGYTSSICLVALLAVLMVFYVGFWSAETILHMIAPTGVLGHAMFIVVVSSTMMRFRD